MLIDTHTHYYDDRYEGGGDAAVDRAVAAGVGKMIQADIDSRERESMWAVGERHKGVLFQMAGVYPGSIGPDWKQEIDAMLPYIDKGAVAIGEIGLDYHEGKEYAALQMEALRVQFEFASKLDLPVNIHLRDAWDDFFKVLEESRHLGLRGNLHCFSGSHELFERANRSGDFSVGIGGVVTFRNASLRETVKKIPLEKILLETDCPYLAPTPHRGECNESAYLPLIADEIALLKGVSREEVEAVTTESAEKLFRI